MLKPSCPSLCQTAGRWFDRGRAAPPASEKPTAGNVIAATNRCARPRPQENIRSFHPRNMSHLTVPMTFSARHSALYISAFPSLSRDVDVAAASVRDQALASTISGGSAWCGGVALRGTSRSPKIIEARHDCGHGIGGVIDRGRDLHRASTSPHASSRASGTSARPLGAVTPRRTFCGLT